MNESGLDRERIEELTTQILILLRQNYVRGPISRDRVYEALNALAYCTAVTVRGTDPDEALKWFSDALNISLKQ
jgi:hypothetical protein